MLKITKGKSTFLLIIIFLFITVFSSIQMMFTQPVSAASLSVGNSSFELSDGNNNPLNWTVVSGTDFYDGAEIILDSFKNQ